MSDATNKNMSEVTCKNLNYQVLRPLQCNWLRPKEREWSFLGLSYQGAIQRGRERLKNSEGQTQTQCPSNSAATQTNQLDLLATELKDLQRTDDSLEAVRQAASVQPSTCICVKLQTWCVHLELHCCTLNATAY